MRWVKFKRYFPISPELGYGILEGSEHLMTDNQIAEINEYHARRNISGESFEFSWTPEDEAKIYKGGDIADGTKIALYYPGGIGDIVCETAIVKALHDRFPKCSIRVFAPLNGAAAFFNNPWIEDSCARPTYPTRAAMEMCEVWMLGDSVVYRLNDSNQPNIYDVYTSHFHIEIVDKRPFLFVTKDEADTLYTRLTSVLGADIRDDALLLFAPCATRPNRSWPQQHWIRFVRCAKNMGYRVIAMGSPTDYQPLSTLSGECAVLSGGLNQREFIVLCNEADRIVSVDTSLVHIGAGCEIPTIALYGPFAPRMRVSTYPLCRPLWPSHVCSHSPCCYHDLAWYDKCNFKTRLTCGVLDNITADQVLKELETMDTPDKTIPILNLYKHGVK